MNRVLLASLMVSLSVAAAWSGCSAAELSADLQLGGDALVERLAQIVQDRDFTALSTLLTQIIREPLSGEGLDLAESSLMRDLIGDEVDMIQSEIDTIRSVGLDISDGLSEVVSNLRENLSDGVANLAGSLNEPTSSDLSLLDDNIRRIVDILVATVRLSVVEAVADGSQAATGVLDSAVDGVGNVMQPVGNSVGRVLGATGISGAQ